MTFICNAWRFAVRRGEPCSVFGANAWQDASRAARLRCIIIIGAVVHGDFLQNGCCTVCERYVCVRV